MACKRIIMPNELISNELANTLPLLYNRVLHIQQLSTEVDSMNCYRRLTQKCLCIFCNFHFQISFLGNFLYATGVFYSEISHTSYSRPRKSGQFCELLCTPTDGRVTL